MLGTVLATEGIAQKVLTVHSRGAAREVIAALIAAGASRAVLHWFSGTLGDVDSALGAGCWFSINPSMMRSQRGNKIVARIPRDRILVETDGPYVSVRGKAAEPKDIWSVIDYLARHWQMSRSATAALVENNLARLVRDL